MSEKQNIIILGAGMAGLITAFELEQQGFQPTIIESADRVGGRIATDQLDGFRFDHGFQVLLTAYPEAQRYLEFDELDLCYFQPGAKIYHDGKVQIFADPIRQPSAVLAMLFSSLATPRDKWLTWKLKMELQRQSIAQIFSEESKSTLEFLRGYGFSDRIISNFFRPFFSGIFLEPDLITSSRMFRYVFKMFGEGHAAIPRLGMQAIPDQLKTKLERTRFHFNSRANAVTSEKIWLEDGRSYDFDRLIIATDPGPVLEGKASSVEAYRSTLNIYFSCSKVKRTPIIGLVPDQTFLINNFCVLDNVCSDYAPDDKSLISVTVVGIPALPEEAVIEQVKAELEQIETFMDLQFLRSYPIARALPVIDQPTIIPNREDMKLAENIYTTGDQLLNGSLNAAMAAGRHCAQLVHEMLA